jgi:hypothetical protein
MKKTMTIRQWCNPCPLLQAPEVAHPDYRLFFMTMSLYIWCVTI